MKNKLKTIALTLIAALIITAMPVGTVTAEAASKPAQVKNLKKTAVTSNSITVKFKKVKNIKGYQIRVYNTKNKLVKSKTTKKTKYKITGLKASTKYKIKVRAYKVSNKKKVYGKLSSAITVKTKKKTTNKVTPTPTVKPSKQTLKEQYETMRDKWIKANITAKMKKDIKNGKNLQIHANTIESFIGYSEYGYGLNLKISNTGTKDMYLAFKRSTAHPQAAVKIIADVYQQLGIRAEVVDPKEYTEKEKSYYGCKFMEYVKNPNDTGLCIIDNRECDPYYQNDDYYDVTVIEITETIKASYRVSIPIEQMEYFDD